MQVCDESECRGQPWIGTLLIVCAITTTPILVVGANYAYAPFSVLGFLILNFGSHAALHKTLFKVRGKWSFFANETVLLLAYGLQLLNYQMIFDGHMRQHHRDGRNDPRTNDIADGPLNMRSYAKYYVGLIFVPYLYWLTIGFLRSVYVVRKRSETRSGRRFAPYLLPPLVPQLLILAYIVTALLLNPIHFIVYFVTTTLLWNLLQNVAHYGLSGETRRLNAIAARSYRVNWVVRLITFGSLAHVEHHVFPNVPGYQLSSDSMQLRVAEKIGAPPIHRIGTLTFLKDVLTQFKGPIARETLSTAWYEK